MSKHLVQPKTKHATQPSPLHSLSLNSEPPVAMPRLVCPVCKASDFDEGDAGEPVCNICGTELVVGNQERLEVSYDARGSSQRIHQVRHVKASAFAPSAEGVDLDSQNVGASIRSGFKRKRVESATKLPRTSGLYDREQPNRTHKGVSGGGGGSGSVLASVT